MKTFYRTIIVLVLVFTASAVNAETKLGTAGWRYESRYNRWAPDSRGGGLVDKIGDVSVIFAVGKKENIVQPGDTDLSSLDLYVFELIFFIDTNGNEYPDDEVVRRIEATNVTFVSWQNNGSDTSITFSCEYEIPADMGGGDDVPF